ncbi:MAG TPA: aminotransferase class V-fold PLP-dependent enzyme, partial [Stellaceae bacterium]
ATHRFGRDAAAAVERAREQVAALIGADGREIVFTSGATESNNIAIKGASRFLREHAGRDHVVTGATEHKCVLESCRALEREGFALTVLPVGGDGLLSPEVVAAALTERTALVSVMAANNEIGVLQPVAEIGALCRARGVLFHTDAAQAAGKMPLDVEAMRVDLMSISGHKLYGPKGIGALYVRRRPRVRLAPLFDGGGQERGVRSGTLPTPLCVGLGAACAIAAAEMAEEAQRLVGLRDRLLAALHRAVPDLRLNGDFARRLPGNLNFSVPGVTAEALIEACPGLAMSTGSACSAASVEPSYVLRALGLDDNTAAGGVRIGLGRFTTEAEADYAADTIAAAVRRLRGGGGLGRVTSGGRDAT